MVEENLHEMEFLSGFTQRIIFLKLQIKAKTQSDTEHFLLNQEITDQDIPVSHSISVSFCCMEICVDTSRLGDWTGR